MYFNTIANFRGDKAIAGRQAVESFLFTSFTVHPDPFLIKSKEFLSFRKKRARYIVGGPSSVSTSVIQMCAQAENGWYTLD